LIEAKGERIDEEKKDGVSAGALAATAVTVVEKFVRSKF
jgi:hypothetical protein